MGDNTIIAEIVRSRRTAGPRGSMRTRVGDSADTRTRPTVAEGGVALRAVWLTNSSTSSTHCNGEPAMEAQTKIENS